MLNIPRLTDWDGNGISIQPNAALCVVFSGVAVLALATHRVRTTAVCGAIVLTISGLTLLQWVSGLSFGIDALLMFGRAWGRVGVVFPGRMGPPGSLCWTLIGAALVLSACPPRLRRAAPALVLTTAALSALSLIGYLYGVEQLYALPYLTVIALQTSTFLLAVSVGIIASHPEREPMRTLVDPGGAGLLARRALPLLLTVPVVLGWLRVKGQEAGLYATGLGTASLVAILIAFLTGLLWWVIKAVRMREQGLDDARVAAEADARLLEVREHRIAGLLGSITDAFMSFDTQWRFTFVNDHCVKRMGKSREELIGRNLWEVFPAAVGNEAHAQLRRAMRDRVPVEYEVFYTPWQRWFFDRAFPTPDGGLAVYSLDVTERKRAEDQVRRGAELLTLLIDRSPSGFYIVDADFRISHINADSQQRAFRSVNPAIGRRLDDAMRVLWPEPLATELIAILRRTLDTGESYKSPGLVSPRADVDWVETYEWQLERITMPDGQFAVVCYYFDTTRLREAEQALRDADRRKDEFLATLAHELRNPLAPVRNAVHLLHMKGPAVPELQWARDVIDRQIQQMTRLIDDLMDVSRISRGKIELKRERAALETVIQGAVETSRPLIDQCRHELTVTLPPQSLHLDADVTRLAQVFANLLNNASKYTPPGGAIHLTAERQGSDVVVSVKDTGIGIPGDKLRSIFELFSQVQGALERSQGGLGIGLSLVKGLVEMHGGTVEARSEGPGTGSKFVVRLPIVVGQQNAIAPRDWAEQEVWASSLRILIVDDNRDAADSLGMMLRMMGNDIRTAYDGEAAVRAADEFRPQVVLLDIGLPKLNGYEACRRIRQESWGQRMALIAVTGWGQEEDKRRAEDAGFDQHMVKPVDPRGLITLLGSLPVRQAVLE